MSEKLKLTASVPKTSVAIGPNDPQQKNSTPMQHGEHDFTLFRFCTFYIHKIFQTTYKKTCTFTAEVLKKMKMC